MDEGYVLADVNTEGDRAIFQLGEPLGFNLLVDTGGTRYVYLGNFANFRAESAIWRTKMLARAIDARRATWPRRVELGALSQEQAGNLDKVFADFRIWIVINQESGRGEIERELQNADLAYDSRVITLDEVAHRMESLGEILR